MKVRFDGEAKTTETGYVTSPEQLPITGLAVDVAGGGSGTITLMDMRCAPNNAGM